MTTRSLAYWIALLGALELALWGHWNDAPRAFHAGALALAAMLVATGWRRGGARGRAIAALALLPVLLSLLAWAGVPPQRPNPLADFWRNHALERRVLATIVARGPVRLFGREIALDEHGFRQDPRALPADAFRIVALGGSTTFGATRGADEEPWPALLEQRIEALECRRPVVVVNAGRVGRGLGGELAQFDQEIAPLTPDLVLHYPAPQDVADLMDEVPADVVPSAPVPPRASALLRRLELAWRGRGVARRFRDALDTDPPALDLDSVALANTYRRLVLDLRRRGIEVALLTGSLALDASSGEPEIQQHELLDVRTRRLVLANRFHARFARALAASYRARWIDTRPGLDGAGDEAFLDLFHLTQAGRERLADNVFEGLLPLLARPDPGCKPPPASS